MEKWWKLSAEKVIQFMQTDIKMGLKGDEAIRRFEQFGPNNLPEGKKASVIKIFIQQFASVMVLILIGVLIITALFGEWVDTISIGIIVILNGIIGFVQEYKAESSLSALRKLTELTSVVIRDGMHKPLSSTSIVPGDVVMLKAGDRVPADGRIVYAAELATQEASLTGESMPIQKHPDSISESVVVLAERKNMAFMGTVVVNGKGLLVVTETGKESQMGKIANLLALDQDKKTPLQVRLEKLGHKLVGVCFIVVGIVFILGMVRGGSVIDSIFTALSLAVAAIPEGLPAVMTVALAVGIKRMSKRNALIRRLPSVETLGCTTVICSDKTGTLTKNEMTVRSVWVNNTIVTVSGIGYEPKGNFKIDGTVIDPQNNDSLMCLLKTAILCNSAELQFDEGEWRVLGDPTEGALITLAAKAGLQQQKLEQKALLIKEVPFSSDRKRMSVLRKVDDKKTLFVKGSPEIILQKSTNILVDGKEIPLTEEQRQKVLKVNNDFAHSALRVLACAIGTVDTEKLDEDCEDNLTFVGLAAMMDPPRDGVKESIAICKKAGIRVVMITGDQKETAVAIAQELEIMDGEFRAMTGLEIDNLNSLENVVQNIAVYARVTAAHKMKIIDAWKSKNAVVAMTGDGVNDAPAIKASDIGIAMGISGTEVAKEAADMVIVDDNFTSIVNAIEEGRGIYDNILKFINYLLSSNIAELMIIFVGMLFGFTDPEGNHFISLLPVHLLWLNLLTDGFPAIALSMDPFDPHVMKRLPRKASDPIISFRFAVQLCYVSVLLTVATVVACHFGLQTSAKLAHTMAFTTLVMLELVRVQMVRSQYHISLFSNYWILAALACSIVLQLLVIYVPVLQKIFKTTALGLIEWLVILSAMVIVWVVGKIITKIFDVLWPPTFNVGG